jgi:ABC-2 type transport system permease protein
MGFVLAATTIALIALFRAGGATLPEALEHVGSMALAFGGFVVVTGPVWARNDLRMDLLRIDVLRTLPLDPGRLVAAEITASAVTASLLALSVLGLGAFLLALSGNLPMAPWLFLLACAGAGLLVPALVTLGVTVQCAIALTFPAWVHLGKERPTGVEAMGQNLLTLAGAALLVGLLLIPPALVGGLGFLALAAQWGPVAPVLGGLLGIAACYGEVVLAAQALGRLFERTDAAAIGIG